MKSKLSVLSGEDQKPPALARIFLLSKALCEKFTKYQLENNLFDYFTIEEVAEKSGLNSNQVLRLGMSGTIIFSILEHQPKNYEEKSEFIDEEGRNIERTTRNETATFIGDRTSGLQIKYISTEDIINIVTNEKDDKNTLIKGLYNTRELDPKKGKWLLNSPLSIRQDDLVIKAEEWILFEKKEGKKLVGFLPLKKPEKVTIPWLFKNISYVNWFVAIAFVFSIFMAGVYFGKTPLYQEALKKITPVEKSGSNIDAND